MAGIRYGSGAKDAMMSYEEGKDGGWKIES